MAARKRASRKRKKASRRPARPAKKRQAGGAKRRAPAKKRASRKASPAARTSRRKSARSGAAARPKARGAVPSGIGLVNHHLDYTTHDLPAVRRFYVEVLGFTQVEEMPDLAYIGIQTGSSSSLGFSPPMPGPPEQWRPPREPALYFLVEDVDRAHQRLAAKGVTFEQSPTDMPWGHRVAILRDPEGRAVFLAHNLQR
jgi:catechol 2,3-dioxygenase-like lactoylglutathione lyase family enzyme